MPARFDLSTFRIEPIERDISVIAHKGKQRIHCTIKRAALQDLYDETYLTKDDQKTIFTRHADIFGRIVAKRFGARETERDGSVVIGSFDMIDYQGKFGRYLRPIHTIWEDA